VEALHSKAKEEREHELAAARVALEALSRRAPPTIEDAILRFRRFRRHDPFPGIAPGLLTCAAFCAYIVEAGLMYPYQLTTEAVDLASVDLSLLGKAVWWDEKGQRQDLDIKIDTSFVLKQNSIAFVTLLPYLQIPDYIALRFNLKVRHVYRGLLLGTGPLVDPGFQGYLTIPLHNLTNNEYVFHGGEPLVAVEFTKLDLGPTGAGTGAARVGSEAPTGQPTGFIVPFSEPRLARPAPELENSIDVNLAKARVAKVESSLPAFDAKITTLEQKVATQTRWLSIGGAVAAIALVVTIASVVWQATSEIRAIGDREERIISRYEAAQKTLSDSLSIVRGHLQNLEKAFCAQVAPTRTKRALTPAPVPCP